MTADRSAHDTATSLVGAGPVTEWGVCLPNGDVKSYGDQEWVRSGQAIKDCHPDGILMKRTLTVTATPWESA